MSRLVPVERYLLDDRDMRVVMRAWGAERGYHARAGGWVYNHQGNPVMQGWWSMWDHHRRDVLDWLTRRRTGFDHFDELINTHTNYQPTIFPRNAEDRWLRDNYDLTQKRRGDPRRAFPKRVKHAE